MDIDTYRKYLVIWADWLREQGRDEEGNFLVHDDQPNPPWMMVD